MLEKIVYPKTKEFVSEVDFNQKAKFVISDLLDVTTDILKSNNDENVQIMYLLLNTHLQKSLNAVKKNEKGHTYFYSTIEDLVERGKKEGDFKDYNTIELTISILSLVKGLAFNRMHIGHKRFICPHSEILMGILLK